MKSVFRTLMAAAFLLAGAACRREPAGDKDITLTIATVNNPDMVIMEKASRAFTEQTGIKLTFVAMDENELRRSVTEDVVVAGGKYDIVTIGTFDTPFWGKNRWIESLEPYFAKLPKEELERYDRNDLLKPIRDALSADGQQYALPFYGESSMIYYRKDLFANAGLKMPEAPTWEEIRTLAKKLNNPSKGIHGIALRGMPGWGQNMTVVLTIFNTFGARWYDMNWKAQFTTPEARRAFAFYRRILQESGEPIPEKVGFLEGLHLMADGKAAMWYDATVGGGMLEGPDSKVAGKIGYALAPTVRKENAGWLWAWALAIESSSKNKEAAFRFITWATSKEYIRLVGETVGWAQAPPGSRVSTYTNPAYLKAAPFAEITLKSIQGVDYQKPTLQPVPYIGIQYLSIPEWQEFGEQVSQYVADYLTEKKSLDETLQACQETSNTIAIRAGYQKQ